MRQEILSEYICVVTADVYTAREAEQTFTASRHLKTYTRTAMGEERLNGLALLYIHHEISIDLKKLLIYLPYCYEI